MTDEEEHDFTPWTPEGADRLRTAAAQLAAAILEHADAVGSRTSDAEFAGVSLAGEALLPALLRYADAQFDYTGSGFPFGVLHQFDDDDDEDDEKEGERPSSGITVLQRSDFGVLDGDAVLAAGRRAYLRVWPDDDDVAAAADVNHLGRALYQLAHADGWSSLRHVEGLQATGSAVVVLDQTELLGADPDEWPEDLFSAEAEPIYSEFDVYVL